MGKATAVKHQPPAEPPPEQIGDFERRGVAHTDGIQTNSLAWVRKPTGSSLARMHERGALSADQLLAARDIAEIVEYLQRSAGARCASMEARVDCTRSPATQLNESLRMARLEGAYSEWRVGVPKPAGMIISMVVQGSGLADIARAYNKSWDKTARPLLIEQLQRWPDIAKKFAVRIRHEDLLIAHARLSV